MLTVQFESLPLQQDRQVLRLLQFHQEHTCTRCMQNAGRHVDDVTRLRCDSVKQAAHRIDVLGNHQLLELGDSHIPPEPQVDLAPVDYEPCLRFAVCPAQ